MSRWCFRPPTDRTRTARSLDQRSTLPYDRGVACALVERSRDGGVALLHRGDPPAAAAAAPGALRTPRRVTDGLRGAGVPRDAAGAPDADVGAGHPDGFDEEPAVPPGRPARGRGTGPARPRPGGQ